MIVVTFEKDHIFVGNSENLDANFKEERSEVGIDRIVSTLRYDNKFKGQLVSISKKDKFHDYGLDEFYPLMLGGTLAKYNIEHEFTERDPYFIPKLIQIGVLLITLPFFILNSKLAGIGLIVFGTSAVIYQFIVLKGGLSFDGIFARILGVGFIIAGIATLR